MRANTLEDVQLRMLREHILQPGPLETDCFAWTAAVDGKGYGVVKIRGQQLCVHRIAAHLAYGIALVDQTEWALHKCDVRRCFRPSHLYVGNRRDNTDDRVRRGRTSRANALLTPTDVLHIRTLLEAGEPQGDVAAVFGVQRAAISKIACGRTWKEVV